jgi:polyisoprenyl-teichoic acid--peptidoglycan teichoic acid transferase
MTDLKPSTQDGARNLDAPSGPSPANLQPAPSTRPAQPEAIPAALINIGSASAQPPTTSPSPTNGQGAAPTGLGQTSATHSTAPTKLSPVQGQPDSSGAPCAQAGCVGTIVDSYCDICGSPAPPTVEPATPTKPAQPSAAEAAASIQPGAPCAQTGCPGTIVDSYCDICGSPAPPTIEPAAPTKPAQPSAAEAAASAQPGPSTTQAAAAFIKPGPGVIQPAAPTKPAQPSATQTTVPNEPSPPSAHAAAAAARIQPSLTSAQLAVQSAPGPAHAEPTATPARRLRILPIVLLSVAATLVAVVAVAAIFLRQVERSMAQNLDHEDLMPSSSNAAPAPTREQSAADALNFVVMGYDSRDSSAGRSGSLMILHLNAKRDQAYLVSFPRDAWVAIPGHGNNRIDAAYGFGGPKLAVSTLENLTNTRMDHAILVDFQGFARLTDEVGGVSVYNKTAFFSHGFDYPKGNITVSGERAIYFVGERRALPRGDFDRAANERNLVRAIIAKTLSAEIITDPGRLFSVVSGAAEHLTVDNGLTNSRIRNTVLSLRLTNSDVPLIQAPVSGKANVKGQSVDVVDNAKLAELRTALRQDTVHEYLAKYPQG